MLRIDYCCMAALTEQLDACKWCRTGKCTGGEKQVRLRILLEHTGIQP